MRYTTELLNSLKENIGKVNEGACEVQELRLEGRTEEAWQSSFNCCNRFVWSWRGHSLGAVGNSFEVE
eukprot:7810197-Alexandrium_andersonii.AAC.1